MGWIFPAIGSTCFTYTLVTLCNFLNFFQCRFFDVRQISINSLQTSHLCKANVEEQWSAGMGVIRFHLFARWASTIDCVKYDSLNAEMLLILMIH